LFNNSTRGQVPSEYLPNLSISDQRELNTEAYNNANDQKTDEELEYSETSHRSGWVVEDEDKHDVDNGEGTSRDEGDLVGEEVEGDRCADDL